MTPLRWPKLFHLPRAEDVLNTLLPSWPVIRTSQDNDAWNSETQDDCRLIAPDQ